MHATAVIPAIPTKPAQNTARNLRRQLSATCISRVLRMSKTLSSCERETLGRLTWTADERGPIQVLAADRMRQSTVSDRTPLQTSAPRSVVACPAVNQQIPETSRSQGRCHRHGFGSRLSLRRYFRRMFNGEPGPLHGTMLEGTRAPTTQLHAPIAGRGRPPLVLIPSECRLAYSFSTHLQRRTRSPALNASGTKPGGPTPRDGSPSGNPASWSGRTRRICLRIPNARRGRF